MASFGSGVSRTLTPEHRQFITAVFQKGKPPLDSEINLAQQIQLDNLASTIRNLMPSGFLLDPTQAQQDFVTDQSWSNFFKLGNPADGETSPVVWANVNGWIIPVAGTQLDTEGDVQNRIRLYPPPSSDSRVDLVFLEVWQALVDPNPSTTNKPSATKIWKYGNVEFGQTNVDDDLVDPSIGRETTKRVQLQYRIRVFGEGTGSGSSVDLTTYPEGLDDPNVLGRGTSSSPVSGFTFTNMKDELGDPGLWRAGDGNSNNSLGTVDGYVYAIPLCAVSRRNTSVFTAINLSGNPNNNGAFDRNPSAAFLTNPREGAKTLSTATLTNVLSPTTTGSIQIDGLLDSGIDDSLLNLSNTFLKIEDEIISVSAVDSTTTPGTITIPSNGRGRGGTEATRHEAGVEVSFYTVRPDNLFADQVADTDIVDLRHAVNPGDWDYGRLLLHNLGSLVQNDMRTAFKQSATGDTEGVLVQEVSVLHADGGTAVPNQTEALDGPDGIRTIFSDAASIQTDVTLLLDEDASLTAGFTTDQFDSTVNWDVGADFKPSGFLNNLGSAGGWRNGSVVFLHIGGDSGTEGARATFRDGSTRAVRFLTPKEYWKTPFPEPDIGLQTPVNLRFLDQYAQHPLAPGELSADANADRKHPGPYYPLKEQNFEKPFIVLGGLLHPSLRVSGLDSDSVGSASPGLVSGPEIDLGINFDTPGSFFTIFQGDFANDPSAVATALQRGERTLFDMLTGGGKDRSGNSSEVYIVLWGDTAFRENNGAFKVVGAGTVGYTTQNASNATSVVVEPLSAGVTDFSIAPGETLTAEFRSQETNVEDGSGFASGNPSLAIVLTDIQGVSGGTSNPWNATNLGSGSGDDYSIPAEVQSKLQINCSLIYNPGRSGTARVPNDIWRVSLLDAGPTYLRQAPGSVDSSFAGASGLPTEETFYDTAQVSLWNRLPSKGLTENSKPKAESFGGNVVAFSEQDREHEVFVDKGSKTVLLRPFQDKAMTLEAITTNSSPSLLGSTTYPGGATKDGAGIFTSGLQMGFPVPSEYMPRFGRLDIPYHRDLTGDGSGTFLDGVNHLFTDSGDPTEPQFNIIGGQDNTSGGNLVTPMFFQTGTTSGHDYGIYATIAGPATPAYQARLTSAIGTLTAEAEEITNRLQAVQSSDLGAGLEGIQLPPYLGIARLYGVYDRDDFIAKGGQTFGADRITPVGDPPTNLLRKDADQQTLFLFQDGAKDLTGTNGDHTYIIPSDAIDITLSPNYSAGSKDEFSNFEFVVEAAVFGFAQGWVNENNYVLARRHNGEGTLIQDGDDPELEGVRMTIPSPAILNDRVYVGYNRTPYQGDPYMTREGSSRTVTDYEARYGQVSISDSFLLDTPIQQFDSNGDLQVETPNLRSLEVLASVDFYTTLGTGNVGGRLFPGTPLDIGYTENTEASSTRIPSSSSQLPWRILPRAFTAGQKENTSRASLTVEVNSISLVGATIRIKPITGEELVLTGVGGAPANTEEFQPGADVEETAENIATQINADPNTSKVVFAIANDNRVDFLAVPVGEEGNRIHIRVAGLSSTGDLNILGTPSGEQNFSSNVTDAFMTGGQDLVVNGGEGITQLQLSGMTERLPMGVLLQDSDFLGENILNDSASAFQTNGAGIRPVQSLLPLTQGGDSFDRFLGDPGELIGMSDGGVLRYEAFDDSSSPAGTKKFRIYRGGGSIFVLSGDNPGGPVDWVSESFPASFRPVLKGGALACKAMLVRNYKEEAFATSDTTSYGNEIQMVVITYGVLGNGRTQLDGLQLDGVIGPTGYGEGYAAADRYRCEGKPLFHGWSRKTPNPDEVELAVFPGREEE